MVLLLMRSCVIRCCLLVIPRIARCLRRDKMTEAMQAFVVDVMGASFVEPPTFDLKACYEDSSVAMPLIFVLSTGSDPNKVRATHSSIVSTVMQQEEGTCIQHVSGTYPTETWHPLVLVVRACVVDRESPLTACSSEVLLLSTNF